MDVSSHRYPYVIIIPLFLSLSLSSFGIDLSCVYYTAIMSSEKFEDLEDELKTLLEDTSNKVRNKIPRLSGGKLKELAFI